MGNRRTPPVVTDLTAPREPTVLALPEQPPALDVWQRTLGFRRTVIEQLSRADRIALAFDLLGDIVPYDDDDSHALAHAQAALGELEEGIV